MEGNLGSGASVFLESPSTTETQTASGYRGSVSEEGWRRLVLGEAAEPEEGSYLVHT